MDPSERPVTRLLHALEGGDARAGEELLPLVYDELRRLARARLRGERAELTLQPTALVHEAWLRLVGGDEVRWSGRAHFFGAAAQAMRRILVERARRVGREKRGGAFGRLPLDAVDAADGGTGAELDASSPDLVALDEALAALERTDPRMARVVSLRFFAGLSVEETAAALDLSPRTVKREWNVARAWLFERMAGGDGAAS